jgi:tetratricopeptide (TPR) repeat protein
LKTTTISRITAATLAVFLILTPLASCARSGKPLTAAELLDLGEKYLLELNYEQAIVQFTKLIEIEPKNARAYLGAAEAYTALGRTDEAIAILEQGLAQLPNNEEILAMLEALRPPEPTPEVPPEPEPTPVQRVLKEEQYQYLTQLQQAAEILDYERVYEIYTSPEFWAVCELLDIYELYTYDSGDAILGFANLSSFDYEYQVEHRCASFSVWRDNGISYATENWTQGETGEVTAVNIYSAEYKDGTVNGEYTEIYHFGPDNLFQTEIGRAVNGVKHGISTYQRGDIVGNIEFDNGNILTIPDNYFGTGDVVVEPLPLNSYAQELKLSAAIASHIRSPE